MKEFWKDYGELCKQNYAFYKRHWKGVAVLNATAFGALYLWLLKTSGNTRIETKIEKGDEAQ